LTEPLLGWDVGGANVKAARVSAADDPAPVVVERPFALWRDPGGLADVLQETARRLGPARKMAVTMTAELADCFATQREGVTHVLDAFVQAFPQSETWVYGTDGRFRSPDDARARPREVAAANWVAAATLVARHVRDALLLDVGSTTADIVPILDGCVAARGRTDLERLQSGELVYTGLLRTPACAIAGRLPLRGGSCGVAAELFAIAADAHLWLGRIDEADYTCETPDGRGRSRRECGARLARLVCADLELLSEDDVSAIARHLVLTQERQLGAAIRRVRRRLGDAAPGTAVVVGAGAALALAAAQQAGLSVLDLASQLGAAAARAVPAAAVALLLADAP